MAFGEPFEVEAGHRDGFVEFLIASLEEKVDTTILEPRILIQTCPRSPSVSYSLSYIGKAQPVVLPRMLARNPQVGRLATYASAAAVSR